MADLRALKSGFTSGELSPKMLGQVDLTQYQFGCEVLENHIVWPQGMTARRPGLRFIEAAKVPATAIRLIPFEFSTTQAYIIEAGHEYFRFYMNQGQIQSGGSPYELVHTYQSTDLFAINKCQSADIMYLAHPDYHPKMLSRTAHDSWTIKDCVFVNGPYLSQNTTNITLAPSGNTGTVTITASLNMGAEKVVNGTFAITTGTEMVVDGDFATAGTWVYGPIGRSMPEPIRPTMLQSVPTTLNYAIAPTAGVIYQVIFTVGWVAGTVTPKVGGTAGTAVGAAGTYTQYITAATTGNLIFTGNAAFNGSIDDVSVKPVTLDTAWTWGSGWTHNPATLKAVHTSGIATLNQSILPDAGKSYTIVFTISGRSAGSVTVSFGNTSGTTRTVDGTYTESITATDIGNLKFTPSTDFDGIIDTVSVKEAAATVGPFEVGHVGSLWAILHGSTWGYAKITGFTSDMAVTAEVKSTFGDTTATVDWKEGAWSDVRGYPSVVGFYENRLFWAATPHQPQTLWGSKTGDYYTHTPSGTPIVDSDPLTITLNSDYVNAIKWLNGTKTLLIGD